MKFITETIAVKKRKRHPKEVSPLSMVQLAYEELTLTIKLVSYGDTRSFDNFQIINRAFEIMPGIDPKP